MRRRPDSDLTSTSIDPAAADPQPITTSRPALSATARLGIGLLGFACLAGPFVLFLSLPPFHTGLWPQSEPVAAALHAGDVTLNPRRALSS